MNRPHRRGPARIRLEALEGRELLSGAGTPDPTFGAATGYGSVSLGVPRLAFTVIDANTANSEAAGQSVATLPDGGVVEAGVISHYSENLALESAQVAITEVGPFGAAVASFGTNGLVELPADPGSQFVAVAEPNGNVVVAGGAGGTGFAAVELNSSGGAVTSFGVAGLALYPANTTTPAADRLGTVASVLLQPDGKIVLVGSSVGSATSASVFAAVRLNPDGSIDTSFGTNGTADVPVVINANYIRDQAAGAVLQADGKIVVAGVAASGAVNTGTVSIPAEELVVLRLNADGSIDDNNYGNVFSGYVALPPDPANSSALASMQALGIALDPTNGDVLVSANVEGGAAISPYNGAVLYRLGTDGTPVAGFGTDGRLMPGVAGPLVVQPDGDIVVAGEVGSQGVSNAPGLLQAVGVLRLNPDGSPDASFGNTGGDGLFIAHSPELTRVAGVAIEPGTGALVVGGLGTEPVLVSGGTGPSPGVRDENFTAVRLLPTAIAGALPARSLEDAPADFDGAGYTDVAVYNPTNSTFNYQSPQGTEGSTSFGIASSDQFADATIPASADYLGIGQDQVAAYLPSQGVYAILPTNPYTDTGGGGSPGLALKFGIPGSGQTIPTPADFDGDGKADVAVYLPAYATFAILPSDGSAPYSVAFGAAGQGSSIPVPADYFGFGRADIAVYLTQVGAYAIRNPVSGQDTIVPFGQAGYGASIPVPGDYDGSGKVELAVYEPAAGAFFYAPADGGPVVKVSMGEANSGEIPVPGDYDGAGHEEFAIYNPTFGTIEYKPADGGPDVFKLTDSANIPTIPLAESPATLPVFIMPPVEPGGMASAAKVPLGAASPAARSTSAVGSAAVVKASAVPAGPASALVRVAKTLVNQAAPADPFQVG